MKGLVLDGGGVFGIGQAQILAVADTSKFDFFVGTSIGCVNAAILASGIKLPSDIPSFFHDGAPKIFKGYQWRRYNIFSARYNDNNLNSVLSDFLPGTMGSVKKPLFIASANLGAQKLKVFYSGDASDASWPMWEVARAGVAAETYFPPWRGYADGGIYANNPSMVAIAGACKYLNCKVSDLEICSIGTGDSPYTSLGTPKGSWSRIHWGAWLLEALLNGAANSMHEYFARSLPLNKYTRIQFTRKTGWSMDNPEDMLLAEEAWQRDIAEGIKGVNAF